MEMYYESGKFTAQSDLYQDVIQYLPCITRELQPMTKLWHETTIWAHWLQLQMADFLFHFMFWKVSASVK